LGSSANILPKELYDLLDLDKKMEKMWQCIITCSWFYQACFR
jgi:hypothetical protein